MPNVQRGKLRLKDIETVESRAWTENPILLVPAMGSVCYSLPSTLSLAEKGEVCGPQGKAATLSGWSQF